jgi:hypothetical protein
MQHQRQAQSRPPRMKTVNYYNIIKMWTIRHQTKNRKKRAKTSASTEINNIPHGTMKSQPLVFILSFFSQYALFRGEGRGASSGTKVPALDGGEKNKPSLLHVFSREGRKLG